MSKRFRYWTRCITVATLTVVITFNPVWAGKGIRGWLKKRSSSNDVACCEPVNCCQPAAPACSAPVCEPAPQVVGCQPSVASDCCTGMAVVSQEAAPSADDAMPVQPEVFLPETTAPITPSTQIPQFQPIPTEPAPAETAEVSPSDAPAANVQNPFPVVPEAETPLLPAVPTPPEPAAQAPVPTQPTPTINDLFGTPAEVPVVPPVPTETQPAADPFGAPLDAPAPAVPALPAEIPPVSNPPAVDDLFKTPVEQPAAPAVNDPFGTPPTATNDLFGTPPAGTPSAPPVSDPAVDLFNTPPAPAGNDLFGEPTDAAPPAPAKKDASDLFGQPTSTPNDLDDLFGTPAIQAPAQEVPADESEKAPENAKETKASEDPFADLFKTTEMRTWRDNTGSFEITAKLAEIQSDKVRLLKENGKYCTVPLRRLSDSDLQLVQTIAAKLPGGSVKFISTGN